MHNIQIVYVQCLTGKFRLLLSNLNVVSFEFPVRMRFSMMIHSFHSCSAFPIIE